MAFFDDLAENLNKMSKDLSGKAQEVSESVKLRGKIADAENLLKNTYMLLGQKLYEKYGSDENSEFADEFRIISEARSAIEQYSKKLNENRGIKVCPKCGEKIPKEAAFCPKCGAKQEESETAKDSGSETDRKTGAKRCSRCGAELEPGAKFCLKCGAPVDEQN
ncbi:MAG: zinc ribbon domain-containing protein [Lachnospiraceae bacterium]|jgi:ribosomal protein L40E